MLIILLYVVLYRIVGINSLDGIVVLYVRSVSEYVDVRYIKRELNWNFLLVFLLNKFFILFLFVLKKRFVKLL